MTTVQGPVSLTDIATYGFTAEGFGGFQQSGFSVANAGDVNNDGHDDVLIGAPFADRGDPNAGEIYLIYGKPDQFFGSIDLGNLAAEDGFLILGAATGDNAGRHVSSAGDINNDDYDDILIGAFGADPGGDFSGAAYVIFGKEGMDRGTIDLAALAEGDGFAIAGAEADDQAGRRVALAGDINNDGYSDIMISAYRNDGEPGGNFQGAAYVIFGQPGATRADIDLGALGDNGFKLNGGQDFGQVAFDVSGAGDINGDGLDDFLVTKFSGLSSGTYVLFGTPGTSQPDLTLDEIGELDGFFVNADLPRSTPYDVAAIGDINGDGFDDFIIGQQYAGENNSFNGSAVVIFGKAGTTRADISLSSLDPRDGFLIVGGSAGDEAGIGLSAAGDVNGDGYADFLVGAHEGDNAGEGAGQTYLLFGRAGLSRDPIDLGNLSPYDGIVFEGEVAGDYAGYAVGGGGDLDGDGFADIIISAKQHKVGTSFVSAGKTYIIYGSADLGPPANEAPVALDDSADGSQDEPVSIPFSQLTGNDSDPDGDALTITDVFNAVNGSVELNGQFVTFTPDTGFIGEASFEYFVFDNKTGIDTGLVTIQFAENTNTVTAADDNATVDEDMTVTVDVLTNDIDDQGDPLSVLSFSDPENGTATLNPDGTITYVPDADYNGTDTFTYTVTDNNGSADAATVTITIDPVNDAPIALDDTLSVAEDDVDERLFVSNNDSDADGGILTYTIVTAPMNGTATPGTGVLFYTPEPDFNGTDTLVYRVTDNTGLTDTATVTITVVQVNDLPVANDDSLLALIDEPSTYAAATLLANDTDIDMHNLTVQSVGNPVNGTVTLDGTSIVFTPATGFTGSASFDYTIIDSFSATDTATVTVTVTEGNLPPIIAGARNVTTQLDTALVLTGGASDPDGDLLTYSATTPANGAVTIAGDQITYTPGTGFSGTDSFTLTVDDGVGGTASQVVTVSVSEVPASNQFSMFVAGGFAGAIGGSGAVFGTGGFQEIGILDAPGAVALDPSFNRGGDIVRLAGEASGWTIARVGSSALLSDGDTFVTIPVGSAGIALVFEDGVRSLRFDQAAQSFRIGDQSFAGNTETITAGPDGTPLPTGGDPAARGILFMAANGEVSASGRVDIFGTSGNELASLISGNITLDPSFNRGGDVIALDDPASDFTAVRTGSSIALEGSDTRVLIPVGSTGATLGFSGGDERDILFDDQISGFRIGSQEIAFDPVQLLAT